MPRRAPKSRRGITLAEVAIATLLTGFVAVGAMRSVGAVWQTWGAAADRGDGTALANQLLDEILGKAYEDPQSPGGFSPEGGETGRLTFDDVDDYDDWNEAGPQQPDGTPISAYTGWVRSVDVKKLSNTYAELTNGAADQGLRKITVTDTDPSSNVYTAVAYRSNVAGTLQTQGVDATVVTWVGVELQVGAGSSPVTSGTTVTNHAEDRTGG